MDSIKTNTLYVGGAKLVYEVRGEGPILLLISGGGNDARAFDAIVKYLVDQYTVVTYDRRGLSHSTLDDPQEEQRVEVHSDDAHRLLKELGSDYEPAYVFGSSGGAIVALDLVARHPEQIYKVIAHEPPTHLVPEPDPIQVMGMIREVYYHQGMAAALQKLAALPMLSLEGREVDIERSVLIDREQMVKNMTFLFEHEFAMYDRYQPDFAALKKAMTRTQVILAGGQGNREEAIYRSASAVAERLGTEVVEFPGRHIGYVTNPRAFAKCLREVLGDC